MNNLINKNLDRLLIAVGLILLVYNYYIEPAKCVGKISRITDSRYYGCPSDELNFIATVLILLGILIILSRTKRFKFLNKLIRK